MPNKKILKVAIDKTLGLDKNLLKDIQLSDRLKIAELLKSKEKVAIEKMKSHKAVLEVNGIKGFSGLGNLLFSGNVIPKVGLTIGGADSLTTPNDKFTLFQSANRGTIQLDGTVILNPIGGQAQMIKATPYKHVNFPLIPTSTGIPTNIYVDRAYWVASEIILEDGATIIFEQPLKELVIIAEKVTVGKNVTFTWQRPSEKKPFAHDRLARPPQAPKSSTSKRINGKMGSPGLKGNVGFDGDDAPKIEFWILDLKGAPFFDFSGQDGGQGGRGQDGMPGGMGGAGRDAHAVEDAPRGIGIGCHNYAGPGGNGGNGGAAGDGGDGGDGGHGGKVALYAPERIIDQYSNGFHIEVHGGKGGNGGIPGVPGPGGHGGALGRTDSNLFGPCGPEPGATSGIPGAQGKPGDQGEAGDKGGSYEDGISFQKISEEEFFFKKESSDPIIEQISPPNVHGGDTPTIQGKNFKRGDTVFVNGVEAVTTFYSDTGMQFTIPYVQGGNTIVEIRREITPGTSKQNPVISNRGSIYIIPKVERASETRVEPGKTIKLSGSGFTNTMLIYANNQEMSEVNYISPTEVGFKLTRPTNVVENPDGESVKVKVVLSDLTSSNEMEFTLETYQMLVFGDSIQWGQGLVEQDKFHSIVESAVKKNKGGIKVYKELFAHSGAIIGANNLGEDEIGTDGEIPADRPTIMQQVDSVSSPGEFVNLILIDGGANDLNFRTVLNPVGPDLAPLAKRYFYHDMKKLLEKVTAKYTSAQIIVTGYYQIISQESDPTYVTAFLMALGIPPTPRLPDGTIVGSVFNQIVHRSLVFMELSKINLQKAVNEVNQTLDGNNRIFFADPNFGPENAAFASEPYIFGINLDLSPQDVDVAGQRAAECLLSNRIGLDLAICERASAGHPNKKGAIAYADAIKAFL